MLRRLIDHFVMYTNIESLCCIPETKIMLYASYTSMKKVRNKGYHQVLTMDQVISFKSQHNCAR